jgi:uncharacterized membrane protein
MTDQCIEIDIDAPADRVWDVLSDARAWPTWTPSVTSVEVLGDGPLRVGSRARLKQPRIGTTQWTVTELVPGRGFTWESRGPGFLAVARHEVEPLDDARARVRLSVSQSGIIGGPVGRLFYRGLTDRYLAMEATGLKARAEAAPPASPQQTE